MPTTQVRPPRPPPRQARAQRRRQAPPRRRRGRTRLAAPHGAVEEADAQGAHHPAVGKLAGQDVGVLPGQGVGCGGLWAGEGAVGGWWWGGTVRWCGSRGLLNAGFDCAWHTQRRLAGRLPVSRRAASRPAQARSNEDGGQPGRAHPRHDVAHHPREAVGGRGAQAQARAQAQRRPQRAAADPQAAAQQAQEGRQLDGEHDGTHGGPAVHGRGGKQRRGKGEGGGWLGGAWERGASGQPPRQPPRQPATAPPRAQASSCVPRARSRAAAAAAAAAPCAQLTA